MTDQNQLLREALEAARNHLDMHSLSISHPKDAALIERAISQPVDQTVFTAEDLHTHCARARNETKQECIDLCELWNASPGSVVAKAIRELQDYEVPISQPAENKPLPPELPSPRRFWPRVPTDGHVYSIAQADEIRWACFEAGQHAALSQAAAASQADGDAACCPKCDGSGEIKVMSNGGPDAEELPAKCDHCNGVGTLEAAYAGVVGKLDELHTKYLQVYALVYFGKHASVTTPVPEAGAGDVREAVAWLPIETAPRDGTLILLRFGSDGKSQGLYVPTLKPYPWKFIDADGPSWIINHAVDGPGGPSHWAKFPEYRKAARRDTTPPAPDHTQESQQEPSKSNWHVHHVAVNKAALQMIRNALRNDVERGLVVRGEMLEELDKATFAIPAPATHPLTRDQIKQLATYMPEGVTDDDVAELVERVEILHGIRKPG